MNSINSENDIITEKIIENNPHLEQILDQKKSFGEFPLVRCDEEFCESMRHLGENREKYRRRKWEHKSAANWCDFRDAAIMIEFATKMIAKHPAIIGKNKPKTIEKKGNVKNKRKRSDTISHNSATNVDTCEELIEGPFDNSYTLTNPFTLDTIPTLCNKNNSVDNKNNSAGDASETKINGNGLQQFQEISAEDFFETNTTYKGIMIIRGCVNVRVFRYVAELFPCIKFAAFVGDNEKIPMDEIEYSSNGKNEIEIEYDYEQNCPNNLEFVKEKLSEQSSIEKYSKYLEQTKQTKYPKYSKYSKQTKYSKLCDDFAVYYIDFSVLNIADKSDNKKLMDELSAQSQICKKINPHAALLGFRLPYNDGETEYCDGDLIVLPWNGQTSSETFISPNRDAKPKKYDHRAYEEKLFYHNTITRMTYYRDSATSDFIDHCYDCACVVHIMKKYYEKMFNISGKSEYINSLIIGKLYDLNSVLCG